MAGNGARNIALIGGGVAAGAALALAGAGLVAKPSPRPAATRPAPATPQGFETWRGAGVMLDKPAGWTAEQQSPYRVAVYDPAAPVVAIRSAVIARGADAAAWLGRDFVRSESWIRSGTADRIEARGPNVAFASFTLTDRWGQPRRANVTLVRHGEIGTLFVASARSDLFEAALPKLAAILASIRPEGGAARGGAGMSSSSAAPAPIRYVQWVDPGENAFAFEIPAGWRIQGGMQRIGQSGPRAIYELASPDGGVRIFGGDRAVFQRFLFPSQTLCSMYRCPGRIENGDIILPFASAAQMGQQLVQQRFGQVQVTNAQERPDLLEFQRRNEPVLQGAANHLSQAELSFRTADGRTGWAMTKTSGQEVPQLGGYWTIGDFYGFVARPDEAALAGAVLSHMLASNRVNPQWFAGEMKGQQAASQQYLNYMHGSQALQARVVAQRWASDRQIQEGRREGLGSTVQLVDPETNETMTVDAGSGYYFRNDRPTGTTIVGTDQQDNPAPNELRRMLQMGKDLPYR